MKRARFYATLAIGCGLFMGRATADLTAEATDPAKSTGSATDGVPQMVLEAKAKRAKEAQAAADKEEVKTTEQNKDWLWRSYEQQLQERGASSSDDGKNLYYKISTDKTLSSIAGVAMVTPVTQKQAAPSTQSTAATSQTALFKSDSPSKTMITPLDSGDKTGLHDFYANLQGDAPPPSAAESISTKLPEDTIKDRASIMDSPGLTAAQSNGRTSAYDLNYDLREPLPQDGSSRDAATQGFSSDAANQLQKSDSALNVPNMIKITPGSSQQPQMNQKTYEDDAPKPDKTPQPSPVRERIGDAREIPYH